jgi:hypothetical protein
MNAYPETTMVAGGFCIPLIHIDKKEGHDIDIYVFDASAMDTIEERILVQEDYKLLTSTRYAKTFAPFGTKHEDFRNIQLIYAFGKNPGDVLLNFDIVQSIVGVHNNVLIQAVRAEQSSLILNVGAIHNWRWTLRRIGKYIQKGFFPGTALDAYYISFARHVVANGVPEEMEEYNNEPRESQAIVEVETEEIFY